MHKGTIDPRIQKLVDRIVSAAKSCEEILWIKIYGSFARGDAVDRSDLDVAVSTLENWPRLLSYLSENVASLRKIDWLHYNTATPQLQASVDRDGILIYEKKSKKPKNSRKSQKSK